MTKKHARETFRQGLLKWSEEHLREFPWRSTTSPYEIFVAEILLSKTPVSKVEPLYETFLKRYPTLSDLEAADKEELSTMLHPLGLQNRRAAALIKIGRKLSNNGIPESEERLLELPYVGKYVANATLCFAFGHNRPIVDSNVIRVYNRVFDLEITNPESTEMWQFAFDMLPEKNARRYNLALLDFGSTACTTQNPACEACFANEFCEYYLQRQ